jgi:hypothetical protein
LFKIYNRKAQTISTIFLGDKVASLRKRKTSWGLDAL